MINSFLLIGQSNMAGRGIIGEVDPISDPEILAFRHLRWEPAVEPLHDDFPERAGIGLAMSFAESLRIRYGKTIGLIPCAVGGTSLEQWKKGAQLYQNAVDMAHMAMRDSTLKGVLWHQGESDSVRHESASTYSTRLTILLESLFEDIGLSDLPVVIGGLGAFLPKHGGFPHSGMVGDQLLCAASSDPRFVWADASGLVDNGDLLHFNAQSLRLFGCRYAEAWETAAGRLHSILD